VDKGARAGDGFDVGAFKDELVLGGGGLLDLGLRANHVDDAHNLLAEEIADLDTLAIVDDGGVDGEMAVYKTHLESELLLHTSNHVVDVTGEGAEGGQVLGEPVPHVDNKLAVLLVNVGIDVQMLEFAFQDAMLAFDGGAARLEVDLNPLGDVNGDGVFDLPHFC